MTARPFKWFKEFLSFIVTIVLFFAVFAAFVLAIYLLMLLAEAVPFFSFILYVIFPKRIFAFILWLVIHYMPYLVASGVAMTAGDKLGKIGWKVAAVLIAIWCVTAPIIYIVTDFPGVMITIGLLFCGIFGGAVPIISVVKHDR